MRTISNTLAYRLSAVSSCAAVLLYFSGLFSSCSVQVKADKAMLNKDTTATSATGSALRVDTAHSSVRFTGYGAGHSHSGSFKLSAGTIFLEQGKVIGGNFYISVNSLELDEKKDAVQHKLRPHLLSADFFNAGFYPQARFEITQLAPLSGNASLSGANYLVSGNLTLKNETRNISFPARLDIQGNGVKGEAEFTIDRTWWHLNYGTDHSLGNKFISETVKIHLNITTV